MIFSARTGFFSRALPPPLPAIFGAGQPMLMSITSGEKERHSLADCAIISGSLPKICAAAGCSFSERTSSFLLFLSHMVSPFELTISLTT